MAIDAKVTFNLRYKQAGNSFSLYNNTPSLEALGIQPGGAKGPVDRLWLSYLPLLGTGVEAPYVRISDEKIVGDSLFFDRTYVTIGSEAIPPAGINVVQVKTIHEDFPDFYDTSVLVVLAASTTQKGRIFMRFVPDDIINYPIGLNPDRNWDKQFEAFKKQLIADKWCIRSLADANAQPRFKIKSITRAAAGDPVTVTTFDAVNYAAKDIVRLSRVKSATLSNGVYTVLDAPSSTTFRLQGTEGSTLAVSTKGSVRRLIVQYPAITNAGYRYVTRRKSGRPFGVPRGRLPARSSSL